MTRHRTGWGSVAVAAMVLAGCSASSSTTDDPSPPTTLLSSGPTDAPTPDAPTPSPDAPTPTSTDDAVSTPAVAVDVTAFPADGATLTVPEAQAVVDALDGVQDRIALAVVRDGAVGEEATALIDAYADASFEARFRGYWADEFIDRLRDDPGPVTSEVLEVLSRNGTCIPLRVTIDYRAMMTEEQGFAIDWFVALSPKDDGGGADDLNPTGYEVLASYAVFENEPPCV